MNIKTIYIHTPFIKLDQLLKFSGLVDTGGEAKQYIKDGLVMVNHLPCTQRGKKIIPTDIIIFQQHQLQVQKNI